MPNRLYMEDQSNGQFAVYFDATAQTEKIEDSGSLFRSQELFVLIQSVELVALPGAPAYQEKIYRARLDTGDTIDLFQSHWDVPLPPESLIGLTPEVARKHRAERMLAVALHA